MSRLIDFLERMGAESALQNTADRYVPRPPYQPMAKVENRGLRLGHGMWDLALSR